MVPYSQLSRASSTLRLFLLLLHIDKILVNLSRIHKVSETIVQV